MPMDCHGGQVATLEREQHQGGGKRIDQRWSTGTGQEWKKHSMLSLAESLRNNAGVGVWSIERRGPQREVTGRPGKSNLQCNAQACGRRHHPKKGKQSQSVVVRNRS